MKLYDFRKVVGQHQYNSGWEFLDKSNLTYDSLIKEQIKCKQQLNRAL